MQTILVVEDDPLVRLHVCGALEEEGYCVVQAGRGDEALDALAANDAVSLIVSDVRLPGEFDGVQLVQEAKQRRPDLGVVIASGLGEGDLQLPEGVRLLRKPFGIGALLAACREALLLVA